MQLTKTDFIQYLNCPKSLWLNKRDPSNYPNGEFTAFLQKLVREGFEVERHAKELFVTSAGANVSFQKRFLANDNLLAVADIFVEGPDGTSLYEVKSSNSIKAESNHDPLKDACFQKIVAERTGQQIHKVFIIHLNKDYVRSGDVIPSELLKIEDVTDRIAGIYAETSSEVDEALRLLSLESLDRKGCSCIYKSRLNHCDSFSYFNPDVPKPSIYSLPRLSEKSRQQLVDAGISSLDDVDAGYKLTELQAVVLRAAHAKTPQIAFEKIRSFMGQVRFPLYFLDYETYASAVPYIDGLSPHKAFPVQYSLFIMDETGGLQHRECLAREPQMPLKLVEQLLVDIGPSGSVVSWHASFEKTQNKEMAAWYPAYADFLNGINSRMIDLEEVFKDAYVDADFDGSTSIKKVLLSYSGLAVRDGGQAMDAWQKMIEAEREQAEAMAAALLEYCKLDTLAMVEIYRFLNNLIAAEETKVA